ncbi:ABC transporter ATP-binding protein [Frigoribacterium faeni]|uniref:ABC transporter n=1 Tax=Frigoribacterium faeni TaxID=145483 RepID=A0A7W3JK02_9MICO|nr:ATP-binding cassette domain-containing protein [Frigoribacterium faeni]MBA8814216.1 ABC-type lipoprotein export system ATPase subunit [Frigoribacterium faeni]GEK83691.1 ABC transporter [Frigoribacterium faeni]
MHLIVDDLSLSAGGATLFRGLSHRFAPGRVTAVVGPSGSGKSTLLAALAGLHPVADGRILVATDELADRDRRDGAADGAAPVGRPPRARDVTWVPQGSNALPGRTAIDNVMVAPLAAGRTMEEARQAAERALAQVGLGHRAGAFSRTLSGGELQRLSLARGLATTRPFVFADEPTASLDGANAARVAEVLAGVTTDATVVIATHDDLIVRSADACVDLRPYLLA